MDEGAKRQLVVITGPIASGKTSLAFELACLAREQGLTAAAIDMDELVMMVGGQDWRLITAQHWRKARALAAALIDCCFELPTHVIFLSGPFFTSDSREDLVRQLASSPHVTFVMLRVSLAESQQRAHSDSGRVLTAEPDFVARIYQTIDWTTVPANDLEIDTNGLTLDEVVDAVAGEVLAFQ